jgi:hypothetical protein
MQAKQLLRTQMELSKRITAPLLADMHDAPLTFPTPNGGNHPTWIAGHLAYSEANLVAHMIEGLENPLLEWKALFGGGSQPTGDGAAYPPLSELLAQWEQTRAHTLAVVDRLDEAALDQPAVNVPPGREDFLGTVGKVLTLVAMHPLMHRGQVADARRAAGRERLMS